MSKLGPPKRGESRPLTIAECLHLKEGKGWTVGYADGETEGEHPANLKLYLLLNGVHRSDESANVLLERLIDYWDMPLAPDSSVRGCRLTDRQWRHCVACGGASGASSHIRKLIEQDILWQNQPPDKGVIDSGGEAHILRAMT